MNDAKFIIQVSKGLIRSTRARRVIMFYSVLLALVLLFAGSTLLWNWLREHPFLFLGYWLVCGWITLLAVLLALYDLAKVRGDARRARRTLEQQYFAKPRDEEQEP